MYDDEQMRMKNKWAMDLDVYLGFGVNWNISWPEAWVWEVFNEGRTRKSMKNELCEN